MAWTISPDSFDVVVVGSGLPECLVAASLVKSGKSVLIIDAVDTYGTDFASFTPAALQDAISQQQLQSAAPPPAPPNGNPSSAPQAQRSEQHEHSLPAECNPVSEPLPSGWRLLRLRQRALPLSGIRALAAPGEGGGPEDRRGFILDLAPKLVYQSEPLVDLLVRCRCHHYLEFKAVEGSYLVQDGALQPVPGGRADIFRDRRLGPGEKRVLMRFIQGCVEARSGQGHLREALSSSRPLAEILAAEGIPPRLREVIMYGIAMSDSDQEPPPPLPLAAASSPSAPAGQGAGAAAATAPATAPAGSVMTGAEGGAALELFTSSQGRFGHEGAFMVPSYGSGTVAEAFVRLCAVHGAVTVLRQPVQALVVSEPRAAAAAAAMPAAGAPPGEEAAEAEGTAAEQGEEAAATSAAVGLEPGGDGVTATSAAAAADGPCVTAIVTAAGQVVRCGTVVAGSSTLSCLEASAPSSPPAESVSVSRAVVVLDSPLLPGAAAGAGHQQPPPQQQQPAQTPSGGNQAVAPKSLLTLVVPPRCQGLGAAAAGGAVELGNPHPVRVLQEGASTCVCPAGRFLLYLSTPATSDSSYDDLWPTLESLVDTSLLRDATDPPSPSSSTSPPSSSSPRQPANPHSSTPSPPCSSPSSSTPPPPASSPAAAAGPEAAGPHQPTAAAPSSSSQAPAPAPAPRPRPRALRAWFYRQAVLHRQGGPGGGWPAGRLPGGVVPLPGPDGGLAGYSRVLEATEAAYRAAFPGLKWLSELDFSPSGQGAGEGEEGREGGGAVAAAAGGDEDDDAIDELTAALARLKAQDS